MRRHHIAFVIVACVVFVAIFLIKDQKAKQKQDIRPPESESALPLKPKPALIPVDSSRPEKTNTVVPTSPMEANGTNKWEWLRERMMKDPYFEYKAPISFYGRVVDDSGSAIGGVLIDLSWMDASEATGNSTRAVTSDANGLFSIEGVVGNNLCVMNLTKPGYTKSRAQNRFSYNYGWFSDPFYHSPDSKNPVVFVMRKNHQGEALIVRPRKEAQLEAGQSKSFPIGAGDVFLTVERLPDEIPNARYWNARVTVPNGGLLLTTEEFPYEAPEGGYTNEIVLTKETSVAGNQGGMLYLKTAKGFGRAIVYYVPDMPWVYVESWFNPNPSSRTLELDPAKVINP